jgi:gamma-glutamylcyclotransferase (GGCT)/AIG2-like uncharacterized protein YtfP
MHRVFVYGSLLAGLRSHHVMAGARPLGEARTEPRFALLDLGAWPGAVAGEGALVGEVYAVNSRQLAALDRFEEVPDAFTRERARLADGTDAWLYVLALEGAGAALRRRGVAVSGGCWRAHLLSQGRVG